ncbi:MAG: CheW domain-containing protein [Pseudomonas sp.]|jgi:purine-binding chemotaxis protein CheW|uniref:CheW-like domain-containing protein n=1 Tax=Pseudomonas fluorescens TaxID=294 RepID=A0A5E7JMG6_PSEFL|nr:MULTISPECIES: CheW domain-containing protein [Pseudomonas]MBU0520639.1 chemotaxis protein CheW [Gammaproteobacteria bacterium]MDF9879669.1 purine-binding chemotaxis protein CheW [Pseudomonas silensiensis]MBU0821047.1 chemotaxis protein CheW [Gammaproteobacteria bacterium]MBU0841929.1 chemotaxis protein CheW [Gammaproteobacteria bacterium]MBU1843447.1 chemotaxis protein CheW [Gammaproteobacteria bacterium]
MNRPVKITSRPQLALQSYLDSLLMEATEELPLEVEAVAEVIEVVEAVEVEAALDEFQAAVLEEQARDAQKSVVAAAPVVAPVVTAVAKAPVVIEDAPAPILAPVSTLAPLLQTLVPPLVEVHLPPSNTPPPVETDGRPAWAAEPFECLLFDVAGLTLAVPLVCLGSIYSLAGHELTPLFGQPEWFLGILPSQAGNLKVLDTARWVMPDRYRDDFRQGLQYVISVQGYEWGLAVHQVSRSLRLDPNEIKWRSHRGQRPWLAGTVIEHMCALLDVSALAELIASGGAKHMGGSKPLHKPT